MPSLDIRDGALDYLFNVYKRLLPSLGGYITNHGGQVNLSRVDVILAEVGAIEDHVFSMKHENEQNERRRREEFSQRKREARGRDLDAPPTVSAQPKPKVMGRAARILGKQEEQEKALEKQRDGKIVSSHMQTKENLKAAIALKQSLIKATVNKEESVTAANEEPKHEETNTKNEEDVKMQWIDNSLKVEKENEKKRKIEDVNQVQGDDNNVHEPCIGVVGDAEDEFDNDDCDDVFEEDLEPISIDISEDVSPEVASAFKERVKNEQKKKLETYANTVSDNVRLHEKGWKERYYSDKCKADDVANHGGREHLFRSYIIGLCWVMKYYYEGCPSWKWYYPFHYAPFASDLRNIERFQTDVKSFELSTPFNPVEQLMAVLPSDSSHAIPKESRWLMTDVESPIIDFYPTEVPVDPNGKAMPWLWVVLLPFIDEDRLLAAM